MIILNNFNKIDIMYRNYIKQFSKAYIKGSVLYVGESLKNVDIYKVLYVEKIIKRYKNKFIDLYMNNNKIYEEVNNDKLCIICLEDLNENIVNICHKCNVKCHKKCLYNWYEKNNKNICPICLKTEEYYLNILKGDIEEVNENENTIEDLNRNYVNNIIEYVEINEYNERCKKIIYPICFCMLACFILYLKVFYF
tara:strand:- start:103 stop:687 length:585 start_codon:yes stop_codon:yes gene_type:complete